MAQDPMRVEIATTDVEIAACFPVMQQLRPHLQASAFVGIIRQMQRDGYALAYLATPDEVVAVAGFRFKRTLFCDRFLYVDDLVTLATARSKGYGKVLLAWLRDRAAAEGCAKLMLDSGIQREAAHRFYQRNGMTITGYCFASELDPRIPWSGGSIVES